MNDSTEKFERFKCLVCRRGAVESRQSLDYHSKWQYDMAEVVLLDQHIHSQPENAKFIGEMVHTK